VLKPKNQKTKKEPILTVFIELFSSTFLTHHIPIQKGGTLVPPIDTRVIIYNTNTLAKKKKDGSYDP
jgi:hypothetical protein